MNSCASNVSQPVSFVSDAEWPVWYSTGNRPLGMPSISDNLKGNLKIYPNPASQFALVTSPEGMIKQGSVFQVIDLCGRIVHQQTIEENVSIVAVDVKEIPQGIYSAILVEPGLTGKSRFTPLSIIHPGY